MSPQEIVDSKQPCQTLPNGTGGRCTCETDCANYWLRASGYKSEDRSWKRPVSGGENKP